MPLFTAGNLWQAIRHGKQGRTQTRSQKAEEAEAEAPGLHPDPRTHPERDAQELGTGFAGSVSV